MQYSPTSRFALWLVGLGGGRGGCLTGAFPFFLAWGASLLLWLVVVEAARAFFGGSGAFLDLGLDLGSGGAWDAVISGQWSEVFSMDKKVNRSQLTQTDNTNIQQQARQQLLFAAWALGNQERLLHLFSLTELLLQKKKKKKVTTCLNSRPSHWSLLPSTSLSLIYSGLPRILINIPN